MVDGTRTWASDASAYPWDHGWRRSRTVLQGALRARQCPCPQEVQFFSELLNYIDVPVWDLHGKQKQQKRTNTFLQFTNAPSGVLLATDVAARCAVLRPSRALAPKFRPFPGNPNRRGGGGLTQDGLWTEARGQQKQSNDPGNNQHILNTPIIGRR